MFTVTLAVHFFTYLKKYARGCQDVSKKNFKVGSKLIGKLSKLL
jgi:hypothetical protein